MDYFSSAPIHSRRTGRCIYVDWLWFYNNDFIYNQLKGYVNLFKKHLEREIV